MNKRMTVKITKIGFTLPYVQFEGKKAPVWAQTDIDTYCDIKKYCKMGDKIKVVFISSKDGLYYFKVN